MTEDNQEKKKKHWYQMWWIWLGPALLVAGIIASSQQPMEAPRNDFETESTMEANIAAQATTAAVATTTSTAKSTTQAPEKQKPKAPTYKVENVEPLHSGGLKRFVWHIVIDEPVSPDQLENIAEDVVKRAKKSDAFNALSVAFYDYPEYFGEGYTLGRSVYAPEGDWAQAMSASPGDYDSMTFTHELLNKEWTQRLTQEEVNIWQAWNDKYDEEDEIDPGSLPDEDKITRLVAEEMGKTPDEVVEIMSKKGTWMFLDVGAE